MILTSKRHAEQPFAGQNTQQVREREIVSEREREGVCLCRGGTLLRIHECLDSRMSNTFR